MRLCKVGIKFDEGSLQGEGKLRLEKDLAKESAISLSWIPMARHFEKYNI